MPYQSEDSEDPQYSDDFSAHKESDVDGVKVSQTPVKPYTMQNFSFKGFKAPELKPKEIKPVADGEISD